MVKADHAPMLARLEAFAEAFVSAVGTTTGSTSSSSTAHRRISDRVNLLTYRAALCGYHSDLLSSLLLATEASYLARREKQREKQRERVRDRRREILLSKELGVEEDRDREEERERDRARIGLTGLPPAEAATSAQALLSQSDPVSNPLPGASSLSLKQPATLSISQVASTPEKTLSSSSPEKTENRGNENRGNENRDKRERRNPMGGEGEGEGEGEGDENDRLGGAGNDDDDDDDDDIDLDLANEGDVVLSEGDLEQQQQQIFAECVRKLLWIATPEAGEYSVPIAVLSTNSVLTTYSLSTSSVLTQN